MGEVPDRWKHALAERYRLDRTIGQGAAAVVYAAHDLKHDRDVAVKILRPELLHEVVSPRFQREIRIAAHLTHPHILPLFDSGEADGVPYFVMPLLEGETLRERIDREGAMPIDVALGYIRQVAAALEYAHEHGVVHRDIKPENILLVGREAMVADFGIARGMDALGGGEARITAAGMVVGTPRYMSPEQAAGSLDIDQRTDVYSLGCVAFEMLTGSAPYSGRNSRAVMISHALDAPPSARATRKEVPVLVDRALLAAMAKNPAQRLATARAFIDALSTPLSTAAIPGERTRVGPPGWWWVVAAATLVAAAGVWVLAR